MTGREIIDMILDHNWLNAEFYFNAADDHNYYLPVCDPYITSGFNDEIDKEYYSDKIYHNGLKNIPEVVVFESC